MVKKTVLAIGIDPSFADLAARNSRPTLSGAISMRRSSGCANWASRRRVALTRHRPGLRRISEPCDNDVPCNNDVPAFP